MDYIRGKDVGLDMAVDRLRMFLPGFYPGCTIRFIEDKKKTFVSSTSYNDIAGTANYFKGNFSCFLLDPNKTYYTHTYRREKLEVANPLSKEELELEDLVSKVKKYYPGFYIGCEMEIIKLPKDSETRSRPKIGDTFTMSYINSPRLASYLKSFLERAEKNQNFVLDPINTYSINYTVDCLRVKTSNQSPNIESVNKKYRIKTIKEMEAEYGTLNDVPGNFTTSMIHLAGKFIKNKFAEMVLKTNYKTSTRSDFNDINDSKDYLWNISKEMITDKPLPSIDESLSTNNKSLEKIEPIVDKEILVFNTYKIGQVVVCLNDRGVNKSHQMFEVNENSSESILCYYIQHEYGELIYDINSANWRAATEEETKYYFKLKKEGVKIIMIPKNNFPLLTNKSSKKKEVPSLITSFITSSINSKKKKSRISIN